MKIAHISDIHWRGLTRHSEYTRAFSMIFEKLRHLEPDLIFLGGDLFHTKTAGLSPEVIDRLTWMLREFSEIAPLHITLGNHDGNLANNDRQDAISPIVNAMDSHRIFLYKNSGTFDIGKIGKMSVNLCVYSCFDKQGWDCVNKFDEDINIAAFHGSVGGTQMDNGWIMPDSKAEVQMSMFDGFDFVLLGDIHKRQFLGERKDFNGKMKPWIGYPGSTIQQNFGEEVVKGFLFWNIRDKSDWDVDFIEVENLQPFLTFPWADSPEATVKALESLSMVIPGARYTLTSTAPLSPILESQTRSLLFSRGCEKVVFKSAKGFKYDVIKHDGLEFKKQGLRNNKNVLHKLYREFLDIHHKKFSLTTEQFDEGCQYIDVFLDRFNASELETTRNTVWSIKDLEFDNLFCYGEGNKISFSNLNGIVGVFGKNKIGKSSLVGALMYVLFNGSDRDGISKNGHIMNQSKKSCKAKITIELNGCDYIIERSSQRVILPKKGKNAKQSEELFDGDKTETKLNFVKLNSDGSQESLNGLTREDTDKEIRKRFGNVQDFLMTSLATQSKMERFIDEGPTSRKAILNRFLDLDMFEILHGFAKEESLQLNAKVANSLLDPEQTIINLQQDISLNEDALNSIENTILTTKDELDRQRLVLNKKESDVAVDATTDLIKIKQKIFSLQRQLSKAEESKKTLELVIADLSSKIEKIKDDNSIIDLKELQIGLESLKQLTSKHNEKLHAHEDLKRTYVGQEKNVRKLTVVPCGNQFPDCLYIKDAHIDKKQIEGTAASLQIFAKELLEIGERLRKEQEKNYTKKMDSFLSSEKICNELINQKKEKELQLGLMNKSLGDINKWLSSCLQEESKLQLVAMSQEAMEDLDDLRKKVKELQQTLFSSERKKSDLLVQLGVSNEKLNRIQTDQEMAKIVYNKLKIIETVQAAFHKNGIPAILLKTQLPALNTELAKLLDGLVDFSIVFETEPGSNVMDIYIQDANSRRLLELGSGMEKMIAAIAIRVVLIAASELPKSDMIIMDEGFNALDEDHVEKCFSLLEMLKNHFKTVMIISHMQRVKETADSIIEVVANGKDSMVVMQ